MVTPFIPQSFTPIAKQSLSIASITEHIALYKGYITHANKIQEIIATTDDVFVRNELMRRFSFEYNGIRNHEYYFQDLLGETCPVDTTSTLYQDIVRQYGDWSVFIDQFSKTAHTRGIGWAIVYFDHIIKSFFIQWVDEQHIGHLQSASYIVGIDMWEHSFVHDYHPSGKTRYVQDFLSSINWKNVQDRYQACI